MSECIRANLVVIDKRHIYSAEIRINEGKIVSVQPLPDINPSSLPFAIPGFIDSHVHIESSMLVPSEFARLAVVHGTVATISDPHEIANVCGMEGVEYMIDNGKTVPFKFFFGAPSCVPATGFETAGAKLSVEDVSILLKKNEIKYLSEMMNFPGVLNNDPEVMAKIKAAQREGKPVDGHAPGLMGDVAKKYIHAGITTDHECFTHDEALDKLRSGMKILIREGSAAKNFDALISLLNDYPDQMMFCSDDKHPDNLVAGHINQLCARAVAQGIDHFKVLKAACINPVHHYSLEVGILRPGDPADLLLIKDLQKFEVLQTWIDGELVAENGKSFISTNRAPLINNFNSHRVSAVSFEVEATANKEISVIEALDGQLITNSLKVKPLIIDGKIRSDTANDVLKIAVVNRYRQAPVATAFIKNIGLKTGAIASSVAHDSHNIIVVGVNDEVMAKAVNLIVDQKGGISFATEEMEMSLALPVAGLMSNEDGYSVAASYTAIDAMAKKAGSGLSSPFMTLSFMALLVIPHLKISDLGLFDVDRFSFI